MRSLGVFPSEATHLASDSPPHRVSSPTGPSWKRARDVYLLLVLSVNVGALQDICGTSLTAYMQLCDTLKESKGRLGKWETFLQCL